MREFARVALAVVLVSLAVSAPASASECSQLSQLALKDARITGAELVPAGAYDGPAPPFGPPPAVADASRCRMAAP